MTHDDRPARERAIPEIRFGTSTGFALGVEEELLLVDPVTHALSHTAVETLERLVVPAGAGSAHPDTYAALVEFASPVCATAVDGVGALDRLRAALRATGATAIGAGIHPDGARGDVVHHPAPRYAAIHEQLRGLLRRTPTAALHVHVGMPDAEAAIRACTALRELLPLLQALAAASPWWHGADSGLQSARAQLFRGYPRADIPRAWSSFEDYVDDVVAVVEAGDLPDYTFLWADLRPHPRLGTVEVRAMDAQPSLRDALGLTALVRAVAAQGAREGGPWPVPSTREALEESSFRAARDGLAATLWHDGALRPVPEIARWWTARVRDVAAELGDADALTEIERLLRDGGSADRQRAAHARGGMPALLAHLAAETKTPL